MRRPAALIVLALLAALIPAAPAAASASRHYVDCSAHRSGDGSSGHPWNRLADIAAHGDFQPGDQILLKRGTICHGRITSTGSGTAAAPIVLGAYGKGSRPTVAGGGTANATGAIELLNQQYWTVQDIHVTNTTGKTSTQVYRSGVLVRSRFGGALPGIVIQRLFVENVASSPNDRYLSSREWGGISATAVGGYGDALPGLVIRDNRILRVGRSGIAVMNNARPGTYDEGVRITGNRLSWTRGDGIVVFGLKHSRIDHNRVDHGNDEWPCPLCGTITAATANAGIWPAFSSDIRIDHNEVWGMHEPGGDGVAFDADQGTERILIEDNYAHDNEGGGVLFCGSKSVTVRFNIFQNNRRAPFTFIANVPADDTHIYNNTISTKNIALTKALRTFNVEKATSPSGSIEVKNNVYFNASKYSGGWWQWPPGAKVTTEANTLVGIHGKGRPHDRRTSRKNPKLRAPGSGGIGMDSLSGYRPTSLKALGTGAAIPKQVTRDFFGKRIDPMRPPRGAVG